MSGNKAIALGAKLSKVQVVPIYPITPQTTIAEYLAELISKGEMSAEYIPVESEHSAMAAAMGSELSGARTFTSTCSQGLAYMHEVVAEVPAYRLPIVMAVTNRTLGLWWSMFPDYSDIMPEKDLGWMQFFVEGNQECLDMTIQAFRIAEDKRILLPIMINLDGYYLSFSNEPVAVPDQEDVDEFLPPYEAKHVILDPTTRFQSLGMSMPGPPLHTRFVRILEEAMERGRRVILDVDEEFGEKFGRTYGGLVEKYECEDADAVLVTMGSMTTAARRAIDKLKEKGEKIGLVKLRAFRPFPTQELREIAEEVKAVGVVDRAYLLGAGRGMAFADVMMAIYDVERRPILANFVAGLGGRDVKVEDFEYMAKRLLKSADTGKMEKPIEFLEDFEALKKYFPPPKPIFVKNQLLQPGTNSCTGCGIPLVVRHMLEALGENTIIVRVPSCFGASVSIAPFVTMVGAPMVRTCFAAAAATGTGIVRGLRARGRPHVNVVAFGGDGGTVDIGLQSLSGAAERGEPLIYICYDNEAYMNTGIQRSGSTPLGAWTTTTPTSKKKQRKDIISIMAAHGIPYAATASIAYLSDYKRKAKVASKVTREKKGLAYIHVLQPCPVGWRFRESKTIEVARLAVQTGAWPLFEILEGKMRINVVPKKLKPISEYLKLQGRFSHLTPDEMTKIQKVVRGRWHNLLELEKRSAPI
jgi:pyruvate ferredoxin oxidoreductase alpha subunit